MLVILLYSAGLILNDVTRGFSLLTDFGSLDVFFLCEIKPGHSATSSDWFRLGQVEFRCRGTWLGSKKNKH